MKDLRLSEIKEICKKNMSCAECELYIEEEGCEVKTNCAPANWEIDQIKKVSALEDTIGLMTSADYKDRFKAEYYQLKIRRDKLQKMWNNWDILQFNPTCKKEVYTAQLTAMNIYLDVLKQRAEIEGIELN